MLFIIGRLFKGDKLDAYKLYNSNSKKTSLNTKEEVWALVRRGIIVVGLTVTFNVTDKGKVIGVISNIYGSFNVSKTDRLTGNGLPIESSDRYTLVGYSGFTDAIQYRLVNIHGSDRKVNLAEFDAMVEKDEINGAMKSKKIKDKIVIYKHCNNREYWTEEESNKSKVN